MRSVCSADIAVKTLLLAAILFESFLRSHIAIYNILWLDRHQQDRTRILPIFTCIRVHLLCSAQV